MPGPTVGQAAVQFGQALGGAFEAGPRAEIEAMKLRKSMEPKKLYGKNLLFEQTRDLFDQAANETDPEKRKKLTDKANHFVTTVVQPTTDAFRKHEEFLKGPLVPEEDKPKPISNALLLKGLEDKLPRPGEDDYDGGGFWKNIKDFFSDGSITSARAQSGVKEWADRVEEDIDSEEFQSKLYDNAKRAYPNMHTDKIVELYTIRLKGQMKGWLMGDDKLQDDGHYDTRFNDFMGSDFKLPLPYGRRLGKGALKPVKPKRRRSGDRTKKKAGKKPWER